MRDIKQCIPKLQKKSAKLVKLCAKEHIYIIITECLRTVAEQNNYYAQGRTKPGIKVTNCKGDTYSSPHQWGIAFDVCLNMDIDHDGKKSDDAYNDSTGVYERIGEIAKSIGLEWGGGWSSIKDRPHFQLPDWGSTTYRLRMKYGTPEKFMKTW